MKIEKKVAIFSVTATIWTGRRQLRAEDISLGAGGKLPPAEAASLGSKKVYDPEKLNPFLNFRKQAERSCDAVGVKLKGLGGYVVPESEIAGLARELELIQRRFYAHRDNVFIPDFNRSVEEWVSKFPSFENPLRRAVEQPEDVRKKLSFEYDVFGIEPSQQYGGMAKKMDTLGDRLLEEVSQDANDIYSASLAPKLAERRVRRMAFNQLPRIRKKLFGLAFLDGAVMPMVQTIDDLLRKLPPEGIVEGDLFMQALAVTLILCDPDKVRGHASGIVSVHGMVNDLGAPSGLVGVSPQTSLQLTPVAAAPVPVAPAPVPAVVAPAAAAPASVAPAPVLAEVAPAVVAPAPVAPAPVPAVVAPVAAAPASVAPAPVLAEVAPAVVAPAPVAPAPVPAVVAPVAAAPIPVAPAPVPAVVAPAAAAPASVAPAPVLAEVAPAVAAPAPVAPAPVPAVVAPAAAAPVPVAPAPVPAVVAPAAAAPASVAPAPVLAEVAPAVAAPAPVAPAPVPAVVAPVATAPAPVAPAPVPAVVAPAAAAPASVAPAPVLAEVAPAVAAPVPVAPAPAPGLALRRFRF